VSIAVRIVIVIGGSVMVLYVIDVMVKIKRNESGS
jgi:hypothetical protein